MDEARILDLVHDSIFVRDRDGHILSWNAASEALYGWTRAEAVGRPAHALLATSHIEGVQSLEAMLCREGRWEGEVARTVRGGDTVFVDIRWSVERDADGNVERIVETGRDVTERRRQEEALRLNEYRYRNMFQAMAVGFWEVDFTQVGAMLIPLRDQGVTDLRAWLHVNPDFVRSAMERSIVVDVNAKALELFGAAAPEDLVGKGTARFWPPESEHAYVEALVATMEKRPGFAAETPLRRLDGSRFDVLFTVSLSPESRKRGVQLIGIVDVSERNRAIRALEQSEHRYRNLFHHLPIALWQVDARGLVPLFADLRAAGIDDLSAHIDANPAFLDAAMAMVRVEEANARALELFGAATHAELNGPVTNIWAARPDSFRRMIEARFRGETVHAEETQVMRLDGGRVDVLCSIAFPASLSEAGVSVISAIDLTDRVRAEEQLRVLQADFAHAARVSMLGELTASIAHEVNQPLAAIAASGEASLRWLGRPQPDIEEVRELSTRIVADARRAADIIGRVRSMAQRRAPEVEPLALDELIGETMRFLAHELGAQGIAVEHALGRDLPPVRADRTQLQQVLVNLAVNAAQAMAGRDERRLAIRTSHADGAVVLDIEDSGPGIPEDVRPRLFDSFFSTKATGMGMGLPICRSILEAHGGTIAAATGARGGARFVVTLPAAADDARIPKGEAAHPQVG